MPSTDDLIDQLTSELKPRRPVSPWVGRALLFVVALLTVAAVVRLFGMRADFTGGTPRPVPLMSELLLLSVCCAVAAALTSMARPAVGASRGGWFWAVAALVVLPASALVTAAGDAAQRAFMLPSDGWFCLASGTVASIASIALLALWLKRGAPTSPTRAAWLIGISGGVIGALAIGLACPVDAITHIGIWHAGVIPVAAIASRLVLPRFLRW